MADAKAKPRRAPAAPKPFYLVYNVNGDEIEKLEFSRKTDDIVKAVQENSGAKVMKLEAPKGPPRNTQSVR